MRMINCRPLLKDVFLICYKSVYFGLCIVGPILSTEFSVIMSFLTNRCTCILQEILKAIHLDFKYGSLSIVFPNPLKPSY